MNGLATRASSTGFSLTSGKVLQASRIRQGHTPALALQTAVQRHSVKGLTETYKNSKDQPHESNEQIPQS